MGPIWIASAIWMGLAFLASVLAVWTSISASLIEVVLGSLAANTVGFSTAPWVDYLAGLGAILLAFLAGTEVKVATIRQYALASLLIGAGAFVAPFLAVLLFAVFLMGWTWLRALIGAIALSTTSVALVYVVILEQGMRDSRAGQIVLASRFVNDIFTVAALGIVATDYDYRAGLFVGAMVVLLWVLPRISSWLLTWTQQQNVLSEPDMRWLGAVILLFGGLASLSGAEAVIPSYLIGVSLSSVLENRPDLGRKLQTTTFTWFAPFYFLRAGSFVEISEWRAIVLMAAALAGIKIAAKCSAIVPLASLLKIPGRDRWPIALLMSTGLTFGTITELLGWERGIITHQQYTLLVLAVVVSGGVPILLLTGVRSRQVR